MKNTTKKHVVTLTNEFHNTTTRVKCPVLWHGTHCSIELSEGQADRAEKILCGVKGCTCSEGPGSIRGHQTWERKRLVVNHLV